MPNQTLAKLKELLALGRETEWVELKEARTNFDFNEFGKYFSALSNEANLNGQECGWLIFGVTDDGSIVGTHYRSTPSDLDSLKHEVAKQTSNRLSFINIYTIFPVSGKRVLLFQIPAAPHGMPTSWKGHYYGRDGESLVPLNMEEIERIRNQSTYNDWTARVCEKASLEDLDPEAIKKARTEYKTKFPSKASEVDVWDDMQFLNKIKLTIKGKITNSAILLLGRPESATLITPAVARITWVLKDEKNLEKDYEHFGPPFILNVERVFSKVRNLTYRHMPSGSLFPIEVTQYDHWVIREALHNCIAHQDYSLCGRINLVETPTSLTLTNMGSFLPGSVENVITQDAPPEIYRNPFLAEAMVNLNMIDTQGGGIKKMFQTQMKRFFPMPDYDLGQANRVVVKIQGQILDEKYTRLLMDNTDLDLWTVILLDKVQKRIRISREEYKKLKGIRAVEGRYPNIFVSSWVAAATEEKARHIRNRGFDTRYYKDMIIQLVSKHGPVSREDINKLLLDKLPDVLTEKQKKSKVHNLLASLVKLEKIENKGTNRSPQWFLKENKKH